jgi:hypothetical protein
MAWVVTARVGVWVTWAACGAVTHAIVITLAVNVVVGGCRIAAWIWGNGATAGAGGIIGWRQRWARATGSGSLAAKGIAFEVTVFKGAGLRGGETLHALAWITRVATAGVIPAGAAALLIGAAREAAVVLPHLIAILLSVLGVRRWCVTAEKGHGVPIGVHTLGEEQGQEPEKVAHGGGVWVNPESG